MTASASHPRSGYTLPVFVCAAAIAALRCLRQSESVATVAVDLIQPSERVEVAIEQVARLKPDAALAITRSDPGDNLDLTRHTPIWVLVEWGAADQTETIVLIGGEGVGKHAGDGQPAIYAYAKRLLFENLQQWLTPGDTIRITVILPEGRSLAQRTSNQAFGIVEGLSLLGTTGIAQPLSAPGQLEDYREQLRQKAKQFDALVFCVGENGLDLLQQMGVRSERILKTANWLGPLLVEAGVQGIRSILLFGYHGKLIKLAGGIFHTHHHVADGRQEILTAHCAIAGLLTQDLQTILTCPTVEAGLNYLRQLEQQTQTNWVQQVYGTIVETIDQRSRAYIHTHSDYPKGETASHRAPTVGTVLFDRRRQIFAKSQAGAHLLEQVLLV